MLLEYNADTDESTLHNRAIELRQRVAGRKVQELSDNGELNVDQVIQLKELNREERKHHYEESYNISVASMHDRIAYDRAEQHLRAEGQVRTLGKDVSRAARLGKAKFDSLTDLEKRIISMRSSLQNSLGATISAEVEVSNELRVNNKGIKLEKKFKNCLHCNRRILLQLLDIHQKNCEIKTHANAHPTAEDLRKRELFNTKVTSVEANIISSLSTFKPQPPRNCHVAHKDVTSITWRWDPPIVDGGLVITEYELSYRAKYSEFDLKVGRYKKWEEEVTSLPTSTWIYRSSQVCHTGFKMTYLRAGSEYTHFRVRSFNLRGWSDWANMLPDYEDKILTDPAVPPSAPLYVNLDDITSSCMHLSWRPPMYDGGLPIVDYKIFYTVVEKQVTVTDRDVRVELHKEFSVENPHATHGVIRNLPDLTEVINVCVCAVNSGGLESAKGQLRQQVNKTKESSRHVKLARELEKTSNATEEYVDSAFFTGVKQRYIRAEHMRLLQQELSVTPTNPEEVEEAKLWAAIKLQKKQRQEMEEELLRQQQALEEQARRRDQADDSDVGEDGNSLTGSLSGSLTGSLSGSLAGSTSNASKMEFTFTYKQRRVHYQRKIHALLEETATLQKERMTIDRQRISQTLVMRNKEQRLIELNLENERLKHYHSSVITSSVLSGADMQYNTVDYRLRITKELNAVIGDIAALKYSIITSENRRLVVKTKIVELEEAHKTRIAKFKEFESKANKTMKFMARFGKTGNANEERERVMLLYFRRLQMFRDDRRALRWRITELFASVVLRYKKNAFAKWGTGKFLLNNKQSTATMVSVGDVMLSQSYQKRKELQDELRLAMSMTTSLQQKIAMAALSKEKQSKLARSNEYFKQMGEGIDHMQLYQRGCKLLYEGDGYARENKFQEALSAYEGQIILLRAMIPMNIKALAICHGRLGNVFISLGEGNRALIEYDRQLSLAREIADKCEESDAFYGLGVGYLSIVDYENAIRYLTIAQAMFITLGRDQRYVASLMKLKECYEKLNKKDKIDSYAMKLEEAQDHLSKRIRLIHEKLDGMRTRLAYTAADIELVVAIERITYRALSLRQSIDDLTSQLNRLEEEEKKQEEEVEGVKLLISMIKEELVKATDSDELEMYSALVHDQPQVVEIEELKTRLQQRGKIEYDRLVLEQTALSRIKVKIKNAESAVQDFDQQLHLENGALMKHTKLQKAFRCVALCSTNSAGNEVTGTATGGYEEFAASEGANIHLLDYHNGELLHVFLGGDVATGHTGTITALLHDGSLIFSGGSDEKVIAWETSTRKLSHVMTGHEGSIVALAAEAKYLVSSSADVTMRLWNKHTGEQYRVVFGHSKSVLSVQVGATWLLSGSADHEIRVWRVSKHHKSHSVESTHRLMGHTCPVTCVTYGSVEVISGDVEGNVFIWWLKTGAVLRRCSVHRGPVRSMQFDSVHIVSCGVDATVAVTDIATGEVLQSLRGHTGPILAVAFDSERILSVGSDNSLRYWQWGKRTAPSDKVHVLEEKETLVAVAKRFGLSMDQLMRWNGIMELKKVHAGMKLIVKKGDPNSLTDAEQAALEREQRRLGQRSVFNRKLAALRGHDRLAGQQEASRVAKIAMDMDQFSLANRLFGQERRAMELFPADATASEDRYSLGTRLKFDLLHHADDGQGTTIQQEAERRAHFPGFYYIAAGNEDEWGEAADLLGAAMLDMMVELMAYEAVLEQKKKLRNKSSVIGRIFLFEKAKERHAKDLQAAAEAAEALAHGTGGAGDDGSVATKSTQWTLPSIHTQPVLTREMLKEQLRERHRKYNAKSLAKKRGASSSPPPRGGQEQRPRGDGDDEERSGREGKRGDEERDEDEDPGQEEQEALEGQAVIHHAHLADEDLAAIEEVRQLQERRELRELEARRGPSGEALALPPLV